MSGFDLPPVTGYDKYFKPASVGGQREPGGFEGLASEPTAGADKAEEAGSFENSLSDSIGALRSLQKDVDVKYKGLVLGEDVELHDVMIAASKSEVAFNLMLEVRNKLVEAWEKLSRSAV